MGVMDRRRLIALNEPHIATTTPAGVANFDTDIVAKIKSCKVDFSPVQSGSGDPSPSNVRPITGRTGVTAYQNGRKNLFDATNLAWNTSISSNPAYSVAQDGKVTVLRYDDRAWMASPRFSGLKPGEYTLSWSGEGTVRIRYAKNMQTIISTNGVIHLTITAPNDGFYVKMFGENTQTGPYPISGYIQLEKGNVTPSQYEQYTGSTIPVTFPALGKNLLNPATLEQGGISWNGNDFIASNRIRTGFIPVEAGEKYTVSATGFIAFMHFYDAEKGNIGENVGGVNITAPGDAKFVRCGFRKSGDVDIVPSDITDGQLEEGSTATSYEPYTNTVYGGSLDLATGVLTVEWGIVTLNGLEQWGTYTNPTYGTSYYVINNNKKKAQKSSVCDKLKNINICYGATGVGVYGVYSDHESLARWYFRAPDSSVTTLEEFTEWLEENPVQIAYQLATPYTIQLIPTQITALLGTNNIWSDTNGNTTVSYWGH